MSLRTACTGCNGGQVAAAVVRPHPPSRLSAAAISQRLLRPGRDAFISPAAAGPLLQQQVQGCCCAFNCTAVRNPSRQLAGSILSLNQPVDAANIQGSRRRALKVGRKSAERCQVRGAAVRISRGSRPATKTHVLCLQALWSASPAL